jgi:nucleotide sugar dehydrogenase
MVSQNNKTVAIVGLGYVGLPLAVLAQEKGWQVSGVDIDAEKVELINQKKSPFTDSNLAKQIKKHPIKAGTDPSVVSKVEIIIIAVPTPVNKKHEPDLTPLITAVDSILPHLKEGQTIVIESTINPGVMDEIVVPLFKKRNDLHVNMNDESSSNSTIYLAHCPERINPGDPKWTVRNIPRVLGSYTPTGFKKALRFYKDVIEAPIKEMASPTEAEAVKILENTFRDINIAFINEMAKSFSVLGIDIVNVIAGAATKPFAFFPHYPGSGVGGHCISVDPYYMIERAKQVGFDHKFLKLAREINEGMPVYTVNKLEAGLKKLNLSLEKTSIALLGVSYKKDVADTRNSPALVIQKLLQERGATVLTYDPYSPKHSTVETLDAALEQSDIILLGTDHTQFIEKLTPAYLKKHNTKLVVDGKNSLDHIKISKAGIPYYGIGRTAI